MDERIQNDNPRGDESRKDGVAEKPTRRTEATWQDVG